MDLNDILSNTVDQERGRELEIANPWNGELTGIRFTLAGPDSETQRKARIQMMDDLADAANPDGTISAENRETARLNCLARCVIGWKIAEDGDALAFNHKNVVRILKSVHWLQVQVDAFAGDRSNFKPEGF